ncbi:MAG: sigma 54-interacting transcriptional regulator [Candidatus Sumerlaeota bacterium]|nr:sigma 54-interacting transcriptional regulator [Candidatus Sumerlaeota bacterium]
MNRPTVLFVDPDAQRFALVVDHLRSRGVSLLVVKDPNGAPTPLPTAAAAVLGLAGTNGRRADLVRAWRRADSQLVLICGVEPNPEAEAEIVAAGADEIVGRPYSPAQLESAVRLGLETRRLREEVRRLQTLGAARQSFEGLVGGSEPALSLYRLLEQVACNDEPALILAEPGVEVAAVVEAIHARSERRQGPIHRLAGEAATPGELARLAAPDGPGLPQAGTLWIEGVHRLGLEAQSALFEQTGHYGLLGAWRLVASTERDLLEMAHEGLFQRALYYRINVLPIRIPPLRERIEDLPLLAADRLRRLANGRSTPKRLSFHALLALVAHPWPGNVAELEAALQTAAEQAAGDEINLENLPNNIAAQSAAQTRGSASSRSLRTAKQDFELHYFRTLLSHTRGNMSMASKISKVGRPYLYKKIREHALNPEDFRAA